MAKAKTKTTTLIPSVLAFERHISPSDGTMYATKWDNKDDCIPLHINSKTIRGLQIQRGCKDSQMVNSNIQTVDYCMLPNDYDTLKLHYTLKFIGGLEMPTSCNNNEFLKKYQARISNSINNNYFQTIAKRYAINMANARSLWRNRLGATNIITRIMVNDQVFEFNSMDFSLRNFDIDDLSINTIAGIITDVFTNKQPAAIFIIDSFVQMGNGQEVFPSEDFIDKVPSKTKKDGELSKKLYSTYNIAAMHMQKIGNAIRTIDTWYNDYPTEQFPIAIEPYGSVINIGKIMRNTTSKTDFYTLFDNWVLNDDCALTEEQLNYVLANLIRGGVFGGKGNEDNTEG